jgi:hypothetical protein
MTQGDIPMWEDPQESSALRQLLRAGQVENSDYDVERGLARHLAQLQGGTPLPAWASAGQTTLQKSASWSILAWLLPPMISAGVVGAWLALRPADPTPALLVAMSAQPMSAQPMSAQPMSAQPMSAQTIERLATPSTPATLAWPENLVAQEPASKSAGQDHDVREDARDSADHHVVIARNARLATRTSGARRIRSSRAEEVVTASGALTPSNRDGNGNGSGSGAGNLSANVTAAEPTKSPAEEALASKAAARAVVSPAAQEPVPALAPVEEAKPKAERRAKEEESAKIDEVSGARLEREMRMLAVAQRVLSEDPARSLRLCRQGENEFHGSMFSAERKQVALLALVQLGKVDQARREGIPFLRAFPNAPWSARLRAALSTGKLPNP